LILADLRAKLFGFRLTHHLRFVLPMVFGFRLTPDGAEYIRMANGEVCANPYHLRFVLPMVCRDNRYAWVAVTYGSLALASVLTGVLALQHGLTTQQAVVAALLLLGLPSIRFLRIAPVLVDACGLAFALAAAVLWPLYPWAALAVVVLGAGVSEKVPVFAALFAWSPWLLVALVVPAVRYAFWDAGPQREGAHAKAVKEFNMHSGLKHRAQVWRQASSVALPWGACLFALAVPGVWWMASLAVGMSQLAIAHDTVRLIQQCAPAVCVAAASAIPEAWVLPVLVAHWVNPWMGEGL